MKSLRNMSLLLLIISLSWSCHKFPEDEGRSLKSVKKRLYGTWELEEYLIDNVSYLDTLLKVNKNWNCKQYKFMRWEEERAKSDKDLDDGDLRGFCQKVPGNGFEIDLKEERIMLGGFYFIDSIYFFIYPRFQILRLDKHYLFLSDEMNGHQRIIKLKKI